jgi:lactoylglutathione lyase
MSFCWVTVNVKDMDESIGFYKNVVGLSVERTLQPNPATRIAFLGSGETKLELIHNPENGAPAFGRDISMGFEVESMESIMQVLDAAGVKVESGPFQPGPAFRFLFVLDPNGARVQLVERLGAK